MTESRWRLLTLITVFTLGGAAYGFKLQHERIQVYKDDLDARVYARVKRQLDMEAIQQQGQQQQQQQMQPAHDAPDHRR